VGQQTVSLAKNYVSPRILSHHILEKMDYNKLFYTPRTLSTMIFMVLILNIYAYSWTEEIKERTKPYFYDEKNPDVFENFRWPIM